MLNGAKQAATKKLKMLPSVLRHLHKYVCSTTHTFIVYLRLTKQKRNVL